MHRVWRCAHQGCQASVCARIDNWDFWDNLRKMGWREAGPNPYPMLCPKHSDQNDYIYDGSAVKSD